MNKLLIVLPLVIAVFYACSKDQGATGPQGPQGNTGATGNANVKNVMDSVNSSAGWTFAGNLWYAFFPNPYLTSSFISSGGFTEVFYTTDKGATWTALPSTYINATNSAQWTYSYTATSSGMGVYIYFMWNDQLQHTDPYVTYSSSTACFNVVCITPSLLVKYPETNWNNYISLQSIPELELKHN